MLGGGVVEVVFVAMIDLIDIFFLVDIGDLDEYGQAGSFTIILLGPASQNPEEGIYRLSRDGIWGGDRGRLRVLWVLQANFCASFSESGREMVE